MSFALTFIVLLPLMFIMVSFTSEPPAAFRRLFPNPDRKAHFEGTGICPLCGVDHEDWLLQTVGRWDRKNKRWQIRDALEQNRVLELVQQDDSR